MLENELIQKINDLRQNGDLPKIAELYKEKHGLPMSGQVISGYLTGIYSRKKDGKLILATCVDYYESLKTELNDLNNRLEQTKK